MIREVILTFFQCDCLISKAVAKGGLTFVVREHLHVNVFGTLMDSKMRGGNWTQEQRPDGTKTRIIKIEDVCSFMLTQKENEARLQSQNKSNQNAPSASWTS